MTATRTRYGPTQPSMREVTPGGLRFTARRRKIRPRAPDFVSGRTIADRSVANHHHPRHLNQRIGSSALAAIRASPYSYPQGQLSSGMLWKFMPYMLAISVGGTPTTET